MKESKISLITSYGEVLKLTKPQLIFYQKAHKILSDGLIKYLETKGTISKIPKDS